MKIKFLSSLAFIGAIAISCGNKTNSESNNNLNSEEMGQNKTAEVAQSTATFDVFSDATIFVDYQSPAFSVKEDAILSTLISSDEEVKITFVSGLAPENYEENKASFAQYSSSKDYSLEETTINGFKCVKATYFDDDIFSNYTAQFYIDFGEKSITNSYYGVKITVTSEASLERCLSDDILAIVNSIKIVNNQE